MTNELIRASEESGKRRVVWRHVADDGRVFGPFVEDRPMDEEPEYFVAARGAALAAELSAPDAYQQIAGLLDGTFGSGTYDAVRQALAEFGFSFVRLGATELRVTATPVEAQSLPLADVDGALRGRVNALLGVGKYEAIKGALKAAGFDAVGLVRNAEVSL